MYYNEFYMEDEYIYFNKNNLVLKFISKFYRFGKPSDINGVVEFDKDIKILLSDTKENTDFDIVFEYDRNIKNSGFKVSLNPKDKVVITSSDERGIRNGYIAFCGQIKKIKNGIYVPFLDVFHEPSLKISGVIEGFYGNPWSLKNRLDCINFLGNNFLTTYMYAPKDDLYHRAKWREIYPSEKLEEFKVLLNECNFNYIDFYYTISPGNNFNFLDENDYKYLFKKLGQMIDIGVSNFGVLMDDIDYQINSKEKIKFKTPVFAQSFIVNKVYEYLKEQLYEFNLIMCPTEYDIDYDTPYLFELSKKLNKYIKLFWTGNETLSHRITNKSFEKISSILKHEIIIWDNVPVNDYEDDKKLIFLSPYQNRFFNLNNDYFGGIVLNPMDKWGLSKFTLLSFSHYAYNTNNFRGKKDFKDVIKKLIGNELADDFSLVCKHFRNSRVSNSLSFEFSKILNELDEKLLDFELQKVKKAICNVRNIKNKDLLDEINPFLLRLENEIKLFNLYQNNETNKVKDSIKVMEKDNHKSSLNIVIKFIKAKLKELTND